LAVRGRMSEIAALAVVHLAAFRDYNTTAMLFSLERHLSPLYHLAKLSIFMSRHYNA
jgi:hypothetical protein